MSNLTEQKSDLINEDLFATSTANDPELLYIRSYDQDDEWFSVFHSHPFVEIFYVVDGKGEFVTEEKTIIVEKNDIIIINSDLQHTERLIEGENFTYVVLGISNFSINKTNMHFINKTPLSFHDQYVLIFNASKTSGKFRQVINYMLEESQLNLPYSLRILHHYLRIFLYYIFQYIAPDTLIAKNPQKNKHLYYIKSYMENNFTEDLSLEKLAMMVYMSKFHFSNEFKKLFDITPIDYLLDLRIDHAKSLLIHSDHTIGEIATFSGFHSSSYFSQIFKKRVEMSPSDYRNSNLANE